MSNFPFEVESSTTQFNPEGKALEQIKKKKYDEKYRGRYEEIYLIGVEESLVNPCFSELSEPLTVKREGKKKKCDSF